MAQQDETDIEISIEMQVLVQAIIQNPDAINALAIAVRDQLTKDVRKMGNLLGVWAQKQPTPVVNPPKATKRIH
jgi:hypothetical protein